MTDQARELLLNLSDWIEERKDEIGSYAHHIIHSTKHYEAEIERLRKEKGAACKSSDHYKGAFHKALDRADLAVKVKPPKLNEEQMMDLQMMHDMATDSGDEVLCMLIEWYLSALEGGETPAPEWLPIEGACITVDEVHMRGLWVNGPNGERWWEVHIGLITESGEWVEPEFREPQAFDAENYSHWMPIPAAPAPDLAQEREGGQ